MESGQLQWLSDFGIDDDLLNINYCAMSSVEDVSPQEIEDRPFVGDDFHYHSSESYASYYSHFAPPNLVDDVERPAKGKRPRSSSWLADYVPVTRDGAHNCREEEKGEAYPEVHCPLSKKMDKASVLQDAIEYVKDLQERVKSLEEKAAKTSAESVALVKQLQVLHAEDAISSEGDENFEGQLPTPTMTEPFLEFEAKVSNRMILLRVYCNRRKGMLVALLSKVESLGLAVTSTSVMPFAGTTTEITIISQMEEGYFITETDVVNNLNLAFNNST